MAVRTSFLRSPARFHHLGQEEKARRQPMQAA
jgi:hypothetical protein